MPGSPAQDPNAAADQEFRRLDTKGSGRLSSNEMPEALKAERDKWDTNKDGFIDINEFRAYYKARMPLLPKPGGPSAQKPDGSVPQEEESRRLIVYRNGKSPEGIDDLFIKCDTDKDGQISLAEWRKAGQSVNQFLAMDRNGDGFVTAEEYLRSKGLDPNTPSTALAAGGSLNGEGYPMQGFYQNGVPGAGTRRRGNQGGVGFNPANGGGPGGRTGRRGNRGGGGVGFDPANGGGPGGGTGRRGNRGGGFGGMGGGFDPANGGGGTGRRGNRGGGGGFDPANGGGPAGGTGRGFGGMGGGPGGGFDPANGGGPGGGMGRRGNRGGGGGRQGAYGSGGTPVSPPQ